MLIPWKCSQQWGVEVGQGMGACWGGRVESMVLSCWLETWKVKAAKKGGERSQEQK